MDVIHYPDDPRPVGWRSPVLALGNFDGLHRGHVKIIERIQRGAAERGGTSVVLTFDPHPPRILRPDKAPALLMTKAQKLDALARAGVQGAAVVRFTREMSQWEPEHFVRSVLVEWLRVAEVWVGADFLFGRDRSGNFTLLRSLGAQYGFRAEKIDPIRYKDFVVSSTRIRRLVSEGRVDEAGALLGHHYAIDGTVVEGAKRGRELGFPTANLSTDNELIPPHGVYATAINDRRAGASERDEHRPAPDLRRPAGDDRSRRTSSARRWISTAARCAWRSSSACGTSASSRTSRRSRSRLPRMFAARRGCSIDYLSDLHEPLRRLPSS